MKERNLPPVLEQLDPCGVGACGNPQEEQTAVLQLIHRQLADVDVGDYWVWEVHMDEPRGFRLSAASRKPSREAAGSTYDRS